MNAATASSNVARESPITFVAGGQQLIGIVHTPIVAAKRAVVIVVGGPQYRIGSHRQFVYLARFLSAHGIAVLRFDYRGMGDSVGAPQVFHDTALDIRAAIDALQAQLPGVSRIALWALCDGASGSLIYAPSDSRVDSLILLNPWVRTEANLARTYVKTYYWSRLGHPEFWKKLLSGRLDVFGSLRQLLGHVARASGAKNGAERGEPQNYVERMELALQQFKGNTLFIMSGSDLTAQEFKLWVDADAKRAQQFRNARASWCEVAGANHTFSSMEWRGAVERATLAWLITLPSD